MKITITIEVNEETGEIDVGGPLGTDALIEHGNHDSTPRIIGFNPDHLKGDEE